MRIRLCSPHPLLHALLLLTLVGCGSNSTSTVTSGQASKLTTKIVAAQADISKIRLMVTGPTIPTAKHDFAGNSGGTLEVYPGTDLIVSATGYKADGTVGYEGAVTHLTISAGQPASVSITLNPPVVKAENQPCQSCHETTRDITGQNLVASYKQSGHYTNDSWTTGLPKNGASLPGCAGCHGTQHNDTTPATSGRCAECHIASISLKHSVTGTSTGARPAMYLAAEYKNGCSVCHEPHNPLNGIGKDERKAWAGSAHGDINGVAWSAEDFQAPGQAACQRCHTATGFKSFVANNYAAQTASLFSATETTREVLACDACHTDNNFKVRTAPAFTTPYSANGPINQSNLIPDVGESNLCIPCHTGRAAQADIEAVTDFTNVSFKNPHYLPAAGIMYMKIGFINFTSMTAKVPGSTTVTYGLNYSLPTLLATNGKTAKGGVDPIYGGVLGGVGSAHRGLGTPTTRGGETWMADPAVYGLWETKGPCVTCHVNADIAKMPTFAAYTTAGTLFYNSAKYGAIPKVRAGGGHSLSATSPDTARQVCIPCHNDEGGLSNPATAPEEKLAEAKPYYNAGLAVITTLLAKAPFNIEFDNAVYPYFFKKGLAHTSANAVKDWTCGTGNQLFGKKTMGAAYNLKLLTTDYAGYVHGRSYSQRLIFDSIDFLDDGVMNLSTADTLLAINPTLFVSKTNTLAWLYKSGGIRK